jgi:hypothetical protein
MSVELPTGAALICLLLTGCETERLSISARLPENTDLAVVWVLATETCESTAIAEAPIVAVVQRRVEGPMACGEVDVPPGRYVAVAAGFRNSPDQCETHSFGCRPFDVGQGPVAEIVVETGPFATPSCYRFPFCAAYSSMTETCRENLLDPCGQITGMAP